MKAMILEATGMPLHPVDRPDPLPSRGQLMLRVEACAVCRTDLHVCDGDLPNPKLPLVPTPKPVSSKMRMQHLTICVPPLQRRGCPDALTERGPVPAARLRAASNGPYSRFLNPFSR